MFTKKAVAVTAAAFFYFPSLYAKAPKLLAIVVVDQMRADYFDPQLHTYKLGLKTLRENSAFFSDTHILYVPTETAPGHAAIVTGLPPSQMGIVGNDWYDRKTGERFNSDEDDSKSFSPVRLAVTTIGDQLKARDPLSKVVAVSLKDRAAIMLGGQKTDLALWFDKKKRQFRTSSYYGRTPAWVAELNSELSPSIPWWPKFALALLTPQMDDYVFAATKKILQQYEMGRDDHPDILLVSFSATDNIGHWYGPDSPQMKTQLQNLDRLLGELLTELDRAASSDFALVLTSDHGVLPVVEETQGQMLGAQRVNKKKFQDRIEQTLANVYPGGPWVLSLRSPNLYLNQAMAEQKNIPWNIFLKKAREQIRALPEVAEVYIPPEFLESDAYTETYKRSFYLGRSGDLLLRFKPAVYLTPERSGTGHGSPYDYDNHIPLLFYGAKIKTETFTKAVSIEDIFPTCWDILELGPHAEIRKQYSGRSLTEIFSKN